MAEGNVIIRGTSGLSFHTRFLYELYKEAFWHTHKCLRCGYKGPDIQIHHLNEYSPKKVIETYEDFKLIPWMPLCKKCHLEIHQVVGKSSIQDD